MTTQERFSQTYRDANALLRIVGTFTGKRDKAAPLALVDEWFDIDDDLSYSSALTREGTHAVVLDHLQLHLNAKIAASPVLVFMAMVEASTSVGKALKEAPIWVLESRVFVRPERYKRVEKALRSIYEFQPHHNDALTKVIEAR